MTSIGLGGLKAVAHHYLAIEMVVKVPRMETRF
jgi:hypothetical protein